MKIVIGNDHAAYEMKFVRLTRRDYYQTWQQKLMRNL